jgi:hypothetical protein
MVLVFLVVLVLVDLVVEDIPVLVEEPEIHHLSLLLKATTVVMEPQTV